MTGYITGAVIVLLLVGLALLPAGLDARYADGQASLCIQIGPVRMTLYPRSASAKPGKKKRRKPAARKPAEHAPKSKPRLSEMQPLIRLGLEALGRFRRRLCVRYVRIYGIIACDDPCDTIRRYSAVSAAVNAIWPRLEHAVSIRQRDIRMGFSFVPQDALFQAELALRIRIGNLLSIGCALGIGYLKWKRTISRMRRAEERKQKDGQYNDWESGRSRNGKDQGDGVLQYGRG